MCNVQPFRLHVLQTAILASRWFSEWNWIRRAYRLSLASRTSDFASDFRYQIGNCDAIYPFVFVCLFRRYARFVGQFGKVVIGVRV